ncbi:hypothetical protein OIM68_16785 [Escherichia coli]|jgi:hypothetical protein|uniref:hypothetical protein n=1 Tax=Enterobacteriaceae TaxID=543 RepID=UPI00079B6A76|nr:MULTISPECIES: hypothetical protein [Enterobacteriaceae]EKX4143924.1 hypothetical protein [Enterobacter cloacae]TIN88424.1 MAG: hypothetical protein E5X94_00320 [Mesorhizobium sp.]EKS6336968.1 hypothetical protein [Enterobacter hormaechei]MCV8342347.1 hypothetical protein [Escherichia coli]MCV8393583.1 hypothetical protein [Escherichia coli]
MKVSINIPGAGQVYVSGTAEVINRKALCKKLGICNITLCRLEAQHGFEYALNVLLGKKHKLR